MKIRGQNSNGVRQAANRVNFITKGKYSAALWAMGLYERLGLRRNIHIRRLHYHALLQDGLKLPSGKAYRNTVCDYEYLKRAFDQARLFGFVPYDIFSDTRGFSDFRFSVGKGLGGCNKARNQLLKQMIEQTCRRHMSNMLARIAPVHVEVWLEQTTAADIVAPLAEKYHLNIVASHQDISLTNIWRFVRRVGNTSRPVRILYICDFDPRAISAATDNLKAVMSQYGLLRSVDVKIIKLALGRRECRKYDLPSVPQPGTSTNLPTELHALEVAVPGFLSALVDRHINQYYDYRLLTDAAKQTNDSISRLMVQINSMIDENSNIYEIIDRIKSRVPGN
ncbi:MAG: hypothetical protein FVQ82_00570 [Planctomycetes bacterium]|nr:hypothetical protein [Planctomycetota bacterium]